MTSPHRVLLALSASLCLALTAGTAVAAPKPRLAPPDTGDYIVVLRGSVADAGGQTDELERKHGFKAKLRYGRALKGFATHLSDRQRERLEAESEVAFVSPDRPVKAFGAPLVAGDSAPTGVRRMGAATDGNVRGAAGVNVAVIDTGIDLSHPDLNAVSGKNCVNPGAAAQDDEGHGTHVAGSIGARNNGSGVVGVAPGTKLYAAKVLDASGSGTQAQVICGIDWVASTRTDGDTTNDIAVANMSLGGPSAPVASCSTTTDAEHKAICAATGLGVTFVVAAGNSGWDFDYASQPDTPAAYPEVLTVSAASDSDGKPGALGGAPTCRGGEADDRYASFSSFAATAAGQAHTIAAPGTCITSTAMGGGTTVMSGTSMASPHMAGAAALCIAEGATAGACAALRPADIVQKMRSDAQGYNSTNGSWGFNGDPMRPVSGAYFGYLSWAGSGESPAPAPAPALVTSSPSRVTIQTGSYRSGSASSLSADDAAYYSVNSSSSSTRTSAWYGTVTGVSAALRSLKVAYRGKNSRSCSQTVALWNNRTGAWVTLDSRTVGTTEVAIEKAAGGTLADYVSAAGEVHVRVRCTTTAGSFVASANSLRISYER